MPHQQYHQQKENIVGYGLGVTFIAVGLILALAVQDSIDAVDLTMIGWILAGAGLLAVVLTAASGARSRSTRTYADGTTVEEERRQGPPV